VNTVPEQLLEQLEEYLDGALPPDEVERLNARLASDSELAELLDELRDEREARAAVWRAMEPEQPQANAFADRVITAAHRRAPRELGWSRAGRFAQFGSAAAACLLLGFFFGWLGRDRGNDNGIAFQPGAATVNQVVDGPTVSSPTPTGQLGVVINEIRFQAPGGNQAMLVVGRVLQNSTAAGAGLRQGDVLLSVDGQSVEDMRSLLSVLRSGQGVRVLRILRDRQVRELSIQLQQ
jgi:hypothetical protein